MLIIFKNNKLREWAENPKEGQKALGVICHKKLLVRLNTLKYLNSLGDDVPIAGRLHALKGGRLGEFALDLEHPRRLIFMAIDPDTEELISTTNLKLVTAICILEIVDYH